MDMFNHKWQLCYGKLENAATVKIHNLSSRETLFHVACARYNDPLALFPSRIFSPRTRSGSSELSRLFQDSYIVSTELIELQ